MRGLPALGNLRAMTSRLISWRVCVIVGALIVAALLAGWLALRSWTPELAPPSPPAPVPARETFHLSKPIRIEVRARAKPAMPGSARSEAASGHSAAHTPADLQWLEHELRHLLTRGQMRVAPVGADEAASPQRSLFTLRIELAADGAQAALALLAPDQIVEQRALVKLEQPTRLATLQALAARLPSFLGAAQGASDWLALIGTEDDHAYDTFLDASLELLGPTGKGFTRPAGAARTRTLERLETLVRRQPRYARARAALALAYLSLGGEDETALTKLAEDSAERVLASGNPLAEAHAALGIVHLRRSEWIAAQEQLQRALALDANAVAALEGLACLLVDAGRYQAARPIATRAIALQPANVGARECFEYAYIDEAEPAGGIDVDTAAAFPPAARARAAAAILRTDRQRAQQLLRRAAGEREFQRWPTALLRATTDRRAVPDALQAITYAASEGRIDESTEILCGVALRQADFVFNRLARLQRQPDPVRMHVPLRVVWMPRADFLRRHRRFEQVIGAAGLLPYWQEHGPPDVCAQEPAIYGCKRRAGQRAHP